MVWRFARRYPGHIAGAGDRPAGRGRRDLGVPYAFKLIIDQGFRRRRRYRAAGSNICCCWWWCMALATAVRFYFV